MKYAKALRKLRKNPHAVWRRCDFFSRDVEGMMKHIFMMTVFAALLFGMANGDALATGQTEIPIPEENNSSGKAKNGVVEVRPESENRNEAGKGKSAQALFEESLRQMMPLSEGQIQEYRERSDQRDRALLPVSPDLNTRTVRVALEPGRSPVPVHTTANIATSLVFHDSTGQPWPITSVTNGAPKHFQILRPELPDGNILNVMPTQGYATSTIVVTLEGRDIPLVIRLESDSVRSPERRADALVLVQLAHHGPKASMPLVKDIRETADSTMLSFLDRVPPKDSVKMRFEPKAENVSIWEYGNKLYIRTAHPLIWPAWNAVVNGAGNTRCYEAPRTGRIMLSINGNIETFVLKSREGGRQ